MNFEKDIIDFIKMKIAVFMIMNEGTLSDMSCIILLMILDAHLRTHRTLSAGLKHYALISEVDVLH